MVENAHANADGFDTVGALATSRLVFPNQDAVATVREVDVPARGQRSGVL